MIILEGPDGAGKTSLAGQIVDEFPLIQVGERGVADRDKLYTVTVGDTYRALTSAVMGTSHPLVWDRLFFSEFIYSKYMKRACAFSGGQRLHVLEMLRALKCPVIWCMPPLSVVLENCAAVHQMETVKDNIVRIYEDYNRVYHWAPPQTLIYDYTKKDDFSRVMYTISHYLAERLRREW